MKHRLGALGLVAATTAALGLPGAFADEAQLGRQGFEAVASAQGARFTWEVPNFVVAEEIIDGGGPLAQSVMDSTNATSFAALPWPGSYAVALPGLYATATGQNLPFSYPLYVSAQNPTAPKQEVQEPTGTYGLQSDASALTAGASARLRREEKGGSGGSRAVSRVTAEGDTVTSSAETLDEAISLGDGALQIGRVSSRSVTTQTGDAAPTTTTELTVVATAIGGLSLASGPDGLTVAKQGVPLPTNDGLEQVNKALEPFRLTVRFVEPKNIVGGASAAVFEVESKQPPPNPEIPGTNIRFAFGGAISSVTTGGGEPILPTPETPGSVSPGAGSGPLAPGSDFLAPPETSTPPAASFSLGTVPTPSSAESTPAFLDDRVSRPEDGVAAPAAESALAPPLAAGTTNTARLAQPVVQQFGTDRVGSIGTAYGTLAVAAALLLGVGRWWLRTRRAS